MAAPMRIQRCISFYRKFINISSIYSRCYSNEPQDDSKNLQDAVQATNVIETESETTEMDTKLSSFAEAFSKHAEIQLEELKLNSDSDKKEQEPEDFATMLRKSAHIHLGAASGQIVVGKIFHVVEDDLYIDFGGKFHCVCKRPQENALMYHRGAQVRLRLKDLEISDHFIGATREFSILEADATLLSVLDGKTGQYTAAR